ncbi:hypothetical protein K2X92_03185 [Candidatus Gracilibacteria bacterium]|nr:hypothetical protein [Candidatus Gracilibacteria bacterium]
MEREEFIRRFPEEAERQNQEGNRNIWRIVGIVAIGVSAIVATDKYCSDDEFRAEVNERAYKVYYNTLPG